MAGKNYTKEELESMKEEREKLTRDVVKIVKPDSIKANKQASLMWDGIIRNMKGIDILDNLDVNALATFITLEILKIEALEKGDASLYNRLSSTALSYIKELGLSPNSRVRLGNRRASENLNVEDVGMFG